MIDLNKVLTFSEAAQKWGLANGATIRKAVERNKFDLYEVKKSGNVWLTTYDAMYRVFGPPKTNEHTYIILYNELLDLFVDFSEKKEKEKAIKRFEEIIEGALSALSKGENIQIINRLKKSENIICIMEEKDEFYNYLNRFKNYLDLGHVIKKYF